ncbi:hypothetical protein SAMN05216502_101589 [Citrobacter amalonaticus]|nr:hypothetical protein SAMN05216502_101589 [Citrobacter amalonaticus]
MLNALKGSYERGHQCPMIRGNRSDKNMKKSRSDKAAMKQKV